jgi:hypothetical protein
MQHFIGQRLLERGGAGIVSHRGSSFASARILAISARSREFVA